MTRSAPRTHYSMTEDARTVCGITPNGPTTASAEATTCRMCLRALARVCVAVVVERDRRGEVRPAVLDGPGRADVGADGAWALAQSIAGEPVSTGPRWGSPRSALAAWAMTADERRSVASSSSPDRFGKRGGPDGGPTPTTPRSTQFDLLDVEAALERGCIATTVGDIRLDAQQVRALVEARVCGTPRERKIPGRKGRYYERVAMGAEELAEHCGLTRHQVGIVVRRMTLRIAEELARKGLIPARSVRMARERVSKGEETMAIGRYDCETWKEICSKVGRSEDWCRAASKRESDPLPVHQYGGRVVACSVELSAWVHRQVDAA